ncbi:hypothetical protein OBBRIDRAFT_890328 [Obba rivulosa]|uniref:Uncharacterized protein n=1 Tax=Obba rivulosa TaxID=1052685 RepID=A0A8E2DLB5_9APHY|nr:hypothetical protein OBBRIDRAFT_890328 [Obba rivulosa]
MRPLISQGTQQEELSTHSSSAPGLQLRSNDDRVDATISVAKEAIGIAADVAADLPVPGLSRAFSVLESLIGRIEKTRSNKQEANETVQSLRALQSSLTTSMANLRQQVQDMKFIGQRELRDAVHIQASSFSETIRNHADNFAISLYTSDAYAHRPKPFGGAQTSASYLSYTTADPKRLSGTRSC